VEDVTIRAQQDVLVGGRAIAEKVAEGAAGHEGTAQLVRAARVGHP
jgi:hypothetical protein